MSGGSTPKLMFEHWAASRLDWSAIEIFWVDERPVPPDHEQSNYRLARVAWLDPAGIPAGQVHRILSEKPAGEAAELYAETLRTNVRDRTNGGQSAVPVLDVIHLGLGSDGHTASLFPGLAEIGDIHRMTAAVWVEKLNQFRVTLMPAVLASARDVAMLAAGADKAGPLQRVLASAGDPFETPGRLAPADRTLYFVDPEACPAP